jgi:hypothetical protein
MGVEANGGTDITLPLGESGSQARRGLERIPTTSGLLQITDHKSHVSWERRALRAKPGLAPKRLITRRTSRFGASHGSSRAQTLSGP